MFLVFPVVDHAGVGGGGEGGRRRNSAVRTASQAAVLPHRRSCLRCLRAMVEPSVFRYAATAQGLKSCAPKQADSKKLRCDSAGFLPQVLDYVWQSLWCKATGTSKLLSELGQLAKAA